MSLDSKSPSLILHPPTAAARSPSCPPQSGSSAPYPVGLDGFIQEPHGVRLVGGALPAEHAEQLRVGLAEEIDLLSVLLAAGLAQGTQGHRGHCGLSLLLFFLLTERAQQLGPHRCAREAG